MADNQLPETVQREFAEINFDYDHPTGVDHPPIPVPPPAMETIYDNVGE